VAVAAAAATRAFASAPVDVHQYLDLVLAPDGGHVAAVETGPQHPVVVVRSTADGKITATFDPCGGCAYADPAWSPDGKALAFVGWDSKSRTSWAWVAWGQSLHSTTSFDGLLAKPRYSPNGKTLAVLATEHPSKTGDSTAGESSNVGDLDALTPDVRRIAVLEMSAAKLRLVSPGDRYIYDYDWSPDSRGFVVTDAAGDIYIYNNWYTAKLEAVDFATGATRTIAAPSVQIRNPRVSPDGKSVVFIAGLMDDYGDMSTGGDLWTVPFAGGEPRDVTVGFKGSFNSLHRVAGKLYATAVVFDHFVLFAMETDGSLKSLWSDPNTTHAGDGRVSLSADATRLATTEQSFAFAPRIVVGRPKDVHPITHDNDSLMANTDARSINYSNQGLTIQGWLLAPRNLQAGKTYPLAVYVHGGPAHFQEARFHWDDDDYALLDRGYFIFVPNYRGSFGQGLDYQRTTVMDLGGGDLRDILAGIDAVEKVAPVDEKRLAIFGHSYGGFMVQWATTQTDRFKAAAASTTLPNWVSDYGMEQIPKWMLPYFNGITPYDRPDIYDRISPERFVRQVKTPTFIYTGELDVEAPAIESFEWYSALKTVGVPTSLVIYPGEGHRMSNPAYNRDVAARMVAWFDKYVGAGPR
jgi:dipeptidyl aminopeptidase/acylaminoacyl peptidase